MNFLEIAKQVWEETGRMGAAPSAVTSLAGDQARVVRRVRDCWLDLQRDRRWRWMRLTRTATLVANQVQYTPANLGIASFWKWWPQGVVYRPMVLDADGNRLGSLEWMPYEDFRDGYLDRSVASGTPRDWSIAPNGDLLLGPAPTVGLQIKVDHFSALQDLTATSDVPSMPVEHHRILVWMAAEQMGMSDENGAEMARVKQRRAEDYGRLLTDQAEGISIEYSEPLA